MVGKELRRRICRLIAGAAMKVMRNGKSEPKSFSIIPDTYKPNEAKRRHGSDPTLMIMSVMAGLGMGFIGLVITGQL